MANSREFLCGMAIGATIGGALGLLYAPKPGEELMSDISSQGEALKHKAVEVVDGAKEKTAHVQATTKEAVARGREVVTSQTAAVGAAVEAGKQAYRAKSEELAHTAASDGADA